MAIDRTLFNALLESDGSPNSGAVIDKAMFIDTLLDPIDAALAASTGNVTGPASSVDDRIATFDGTTGKIIQDGGATITGVIAAAVAAGPGAHATSHQNGGSDEISVAGLSGLLADAQTPLTHATSHKSGGSDAIKLDELAAPTDVTTLNATTSAHGLLKKLSNVATDFMNGQGNWATPAGGGSGAPTEQTTTSTGTQNNLSLSASFTYLRCNNASPLVISGFSVSGAAPAAGDRLILDNVGTSTVRITTQDTGSTAAHRVICPSTNGQILGANGRVELIYDDTTDRWRLAVVSPGAPIAVAYNAGDFTASGSMTWTVQSADVLSHSYQQVGRTLTVKLAINASSVGGTLSNELRSLIPGGFVASNTEVGIYFLRDNLNALTGLAQAYVASTFIQWYRIDVGNWAAATNTTDVLASFSFTVD